MAQGPGGEVLLHGGASQNVFEDQQVWRSSPDEPRFTPVEPGGVRRLRLYTLPRGAELHAWIDEVRHRWSWGQDAWVPMPVRVHPVNRETLWMLPASDDEWVMLSYEEQVPWTGDGGATWQRAPRASERAHWSCALPLVVGLCRLREGGLLGALGEEHDRVFRLRLPHIFSG